MPFFFFDDCSGFSDNDEYFAKADNLKFIIIGLLSSVILFYIKDLSLALGQTDRIPLIFLSGLQ